MKKLLSLASLVVLTLSCAGQIECEYKDVPPTGDLSVDLQGCWHGPLFFGMSVLQFNAPTVEEGTVFSGQARYVEGPNQVAPDGFQAVPGYSIDTDTGELLISDLGTFQITVNETTLTMQVTETGRTSFLRRAASCTGYGFDSDVTPCQ